jgi:SRSO17 transposase
MSAPREAVRTVAFIDNYCSIYRDLFADVRSYEAFKFLHLGLISELPRKSLPAIARAVGLPNDQVLHHCLTESPWCVSAMRNRRLSLILQQLKGQRITLVIDETGDRKKGRTTDYVDRQYIGNLGKIDNGIVSVNAYGIVGQLTFPLRFKVFKPKQRLLADDVYQTKLQLAQSIIEELVEFGFQIELVLADSLYGESHPFVGLLDRLNLPWIVAIRSNHGVIMPEDQEPECTEWQRFERMFSDGKTEERYIQEIIFGRRLKWRYWTLTNDPVTLPNNSTWHVMSHLQGQQDHFDQIGNLYGLRTWIEYGFKQCKDQLGWADYRVTHYAQIERWWEIVSSTYLMVSLQFWSHLNESPALLDDDQFNLLTRFRQHRHWNEPQGWKQRLNNVQLLIQPFIYFCSIKPWLMVFEVPELQRGFVSLIECINQFPGWLLHAAPQHFSSA